MKYAVLSFLGILSFSTITMAQATKTFIDTRDNRNDAYKIVKIGDQVWMAENLRYDNADKICASFTADLKPNPKFIEEYGCLYTKENAAKVCPSGWHLPTMFEVFELLSYVKAHQKDNNIMPLIANSPKWSCPYKGSNEFGFNALPAKGLLQKKYGKFDEYFASFWTNNKIWEINCKSSKIIDLEELETVVAPHASIRCIRDYKCGEHGTYNERYGGCICEDHFAGNRCEKCHTGWRGQNCSQWAGKNMTDADGNIYRTIEIGEQTWMAENMAATKITKEGWFSSKVIPAKYEFPPKKGEKYGLLYQWEDAQKICPKGWHLPTKNDFQILIKHVKDNKESENSFLALIATSPDWVNYPNQGGDDFGFAAYPTGNTDPDQDPLNLFINALKNEKMAEDVHTESNQNSGFWASDSKLILILKNNQIELVPVKNNNSYSVRCIKDKAK